MDGNFGPTEQILWPVSVFSGIIMCKIVYEITCLISLRYFKAYNKLSKLQKIEWNNRGFSTLHAVLAAAVSFYLVVISDLFKDGAREELMINRKSVLSDTMFGISLGYFLSDLAMILWFFPSLGGKEYVLHHGLSIWYLDNAWQKSSQLYIYNGMALFLGWLVARILLFIYFFTHIYLHFDQVKTILPLGRYSLAIVPPVLALMNVFWFWKIFKGMMKTLSKKRHTK